MSNYAIILAAGEGKRFGFKTPKCFIEYKNKPIYQYCLTLFTRFNEFKNIVLVVPKQYVSSTIVDDKRVIVVAGGNDRNQSFECGMKALSDLKDKDKILVHDAARIYLEPSDIDIILSSSLDYGTLCDIGPRNNRDLRIDKYNIQTPQFFKYFIYKNLTKTNAKGKDLFTYFNLNASPKHFIISSNKEKNLKITFKSDIKI